MLFAVMTISIAIRKVKRYLMNLLMCGSVFIYQVENSVMDHVMKRAIGINRSDSESSVIEMLMFSVVVMISGEDDSVSSLLLLSRGLIGIRLMKNRSIRLFLVLLCVIGFMVVIIKDRAMVSVIVGVIKSIILPLGFAPRILVPKTSGMLLSFGRGGWGLVPD